MNESPDPPPIFAQRWAVLFGFALLSGLTLVVGLAYSDRTQRPRLETTTETTAVGDTKYFQPPADPKLLPVTGATLNGQPLLVASVEKIDVRDTHLRRVAVDAAGGLTIYELSATATEAERARVAKGGGGFLLKLSPDDYVLARPATP